jgi:hexosaminidase
MPWPSHVTQQEGFLALDRAPHIELTGGDKRFDRALTRFVHNLSVRTGVPFDRHFPGAPYGPPLVIRCGGPGLRVQALGEDDAII